MLCGHIPREALGPVCGEGAAISVANGLRPCRQPHISKYTQFIYFFDMDTLAVIFDISMVSRRPGRYLKTFLEPAASSWLRNFLLSARGEPQRAHSCPKLWIYVFLRREFVDHFLDFQARM